MDLSGSKAAPCLARRQGMACQSLRAAWVGASERGAIFFASVAARRARVAHSAPHLNHHKEEYHAHRSGQTHRYYKRPGCPAPWPCRPFSPQKLCHKNLHRSAFRTHVSPGVALLALISCVLESLCCTCLVAQVFPVQGARSLPSEALFRCLYKKEVEMRKALLSGPQIKKKHSERINKSPLFSVLSPSAEGARARSTPAEGARRSVAVA